jgi:rod shape-determining protein MreD
MRWVAFISLALVTAWLQANFLATLRPFGVVPNLLLIVIVYVGLTRSASSTIGLGLVGGILLDLASGVDFGLRLAFYTTAALAVVVLRQMGVDFDTMWIILVSVTGGTILFDAAILAPLAANAATWPWGVILTKVGIELLLNIGLALVLLPAARWLRAPVGLTLSRSARGDR